MKFKQKLVGKIIAGGILAVFVAGSMHNYQVTRVQMKRDKFVTHYEKLYANPMSIADDIVVSLIFCGISFTVYEILAFGISSIVKRISGNDTGKIKSDEEQ